MLYANGQTPSNTFHKYPDGAEIIPVASTGGYVYVSNSEGDSGTGGVYGLYFDSAGSITNYTKFLGGNTWNCGGGKTPWNTWVRRAFSRTMLADWCLAYFVFEFRFVI